MNCRVYLGLLCIGMVYIGKGVRQTSRESRPRGKGAQADANLLPIIVVRIPPIVFLSRSDRACLVGHSEKNTAWRTSKNYYFTSFFMNY